MKKLYYAAAMYMALGLMSGLFFREFTRAHQYTGDTELATLHTHLLSLGMIMMLVVLALEKLFMLSKTKWFSLFFWHYNGGLLLTVGMMLVIGTREVLGFEESAMLAGIAGLGHIVLTAGLLFLFVALGKQLPRSDHKK